MLKIHCPVCKKSFLWTDDMPVQGKCPNTDCEGNYNIHSALKQNIDQHSVVAETKLLLCPFCREEIFSSFTICRHCNHIVLGTKVFRKSYFFVAVCLLLIVLSFVFKYMVQ